MYKHDEQFYRERKPKPEKTAFESFKLFVWDPSRRAFLDRTSQEWLNVLLFYTCFYGVLFSFFAFQMWLSYKYMTAKDIAFKKYHELSPRMIMESHNRRGRSRMSSLDLYGPGIIVKPNIILYGNPALIELDESTEMGQAKNYIDAIKNTLEEYKVDKSKYDLGCNDKTLYKEEREKPCFFDIRNLRQCAQEPYGYTSPSPRPCVYIKFNKRFGWFPDSYTKASFLPSSMPLWLQTVIQASDKLFVWLSCEGKTENDRKQIGAIEYLPQPGFPVQYFPVINREDYLSPMVALYFKNLSGYN